MSKPLFWKFPIILNVLIWKSKKTTFFVKTKLSLQRYIIFFLWSCEDVITKIYNFLFMNLRRCHHEHIWFSFMKLHAYFLFEGISLHSQPKVKFREYFEYFLMRQNSIKTQPFERCWEHWFYILIIPKGYQQISEKKLFDKKTGNFF